MLRYSKIFVFFIMSLIYGVSVLYSSSQLLVHSDHVNMKMQRNLHTDIYSDKKLKNLTIIDVSGTAMYLWVNILGGPLNYHNRQNIWLKNELILESHKLIYYLGIGNYPNQTIPSMKTENVILALNGRSNILKEFSLKWVHEIAKWNLPKWSLIVLGDEKCNNEWIYNSVSQINSMFLVYDNKGLKYKNVFGWPLGVASYRNFGSYENAVQHQTKRAYFANFVGTIYENSTRARLQNILENYNKNANSSKKVFLKLRTKWPKEEESESAIQYKHILLSSDFTISPVGQNAECYRTYESIELGTIPIVQDSITTGNCTENSPYFFLKKYNPPIFFIKNWEEELPNVLNKLALLSDNEITEMRKKLVMWYKKFKTKLKQYFLLNAMH